MLFRSSPKFDVFRRKETPERWHFSDNERIGDLVVCVKEAISIVTGPPRERPASATPTTTATPAPAKAASSSRGAHGFDPYEFKTMQGIFYAAGPNVRPGSQIKPFENVHVFPFLAKILGLQSPPGLDGSEKVLDSVYRK